MGQQFRSRAASSLVGRPLWRQLTQLNADELAFRVAAFLQPAAHVADRRRPATRHRLQECLPASRQPSSIDWHFESQTILVENETRNKVAGRPIWKSGRDQRTLNARVRGFPLTTVQANPIRR
jgi:hypothetical protein